MAPCNRSVLRNKAISRFISASAVLLACSVAHAQDLKSYILAARRSGAIEVIDPTSLTTVGRIHFPLPPKSVGLNGVSASPDGTTLYAEGPIPNQPNGCCALYSIDLDTLETKQVADGRGTPSPTRFIASNGVTYQAPTLASMGTLIGFNVSRLRLSSDGRWLFGLGRHPQGPFVNIYDLALGKIGRTLVPSGVDGTWWSDGAQLDDQFVFYAGKEDGSTARMWVVSPETTELGDGIPVQPFAKVRGCSLPLGAALAGAADNIFLYERFGWIGDRRDYCSGVPGGAWIVDPSNGSLLAQVAPDLFFSELVANREGGELYGISAGDPNWRDEVKLVRIDAVDGSVLQSRVLESDFWRIAFAPLRNPLAADVRALLYTKKK